MLSVVRIVAFCVILVASINGLPTGARPRAGGYPIIPGDNGSCAKMGQLCASNIGDNYNSIVAEGGEFGVSSHCLLSSMCQQMFYNGTVDDWIQTYFGFRSDDSTASGSYSRKAAKLPENLYAALLSSDETTATQQSFIDAYNSTLAAAGGPYPAVSYVSEIWTRISAWTVSCSSFEVSYDSLADWLQLSSTEPGSTTC
ncbi:hypothetical protein PUNSTDRAFT_145866 [Punctularia strigosozonata HHB-11173 SS5]|uniref:uncharacterized protein n=1 Tax=Punctularia strigosozonata (strain HHB-11173) TaxID=741275 RepID=UPI00044183AD|nr:uncharacterized protein PUNSTDRAFT_145866 [Punctularia strigosozonata HHB-11173 SS5]EIN05419.1 hypothetical protein PUNSTDRAFT_145866 [Punctularia strigosozonata HHB-11173 SS5]